MITQATLKQYIHYSPELGIIAMLKSSRGRSVGTLLKIKRGKSNNYPCLTIEGNRYRVHILIWIYMTGEPPTKLIDHIDTDRYNIKWNNLREASYSDNACNAKLSKDSSTGIKGITPLGTKGYLCQVVKEGTKLCKSFSRLSKEENLELAKAWIIDARIRLHREFTNHGNSNIAL